MTRPGDGRFAEFEAWSFFFLPGVFLFSASVTFGFGGNGPASGSEYGASSFFIFFSL